MYSAPEQPPAQPLHSSPTNTVKIPITGIALAEYPKSIHSDNSDASGGLQYDTYSIIDRSRSNSPVLMSDENASLRSPPGTLKHVKDVDMIPTSLSSSVDAHTYDHVYPGSGSQRTGLMRKPVSPRGGMAGLDPASREKLLKGLRIFANAFRQLARMSFILRPVDAIADMAPGLEAAVIILEMIIMMWLLYELSIVLEVVTSVIKRMCQPAILLGRLLGFGFK